MNACSHQHRCYFVPPHILSSIARYQAWELGDPAARAKAGADTGIGTTVQVSNLIRQKRRLEPVSALALATSLTVPAPGTHARVIYDDQNTWNYDVDEVRGEGDPAVAQENANLAYDALGATLDFYREVLGRNSIDNAGMNLDANVNYGTQFDNAFWDGTRMVFGNGDNAIFTDFTRDVDVPGHELTHGVTQYTAGLLYSDQPGAMNEATSDIFGTCIDARVNGKDEGTHNWLIGEDIMAPQLYGEALRSMAFPGTAYDNPILGTDPQPATMAGYVPGGDPHVNSGIVNRWFSLMAMDLGMEAAAVIWYATLQNLWPTAQFADAAQVATAQARILARGNKVPRQAAQTVRWTAREQGII
jgi:Zn-dependent metalloprotease